MSEYVRSVRSHIGHDLLLLPGVTAVIRESDRFLLARQRDTERWSLIGGGIEPGETPQEAVIREVQEELGVTPHIHDLIGAYGGEQLFSTYPNGDRVAYITVAFQCTVSDTSFTLEDAELLETRWCTQAEARTVRRHEWIDAVLADASRRIGGDPS